MADEEQISVDVALESLPLVVQQPLEGLRIVLLRLSKGDHSWDLTYAAVGYESRTLWVKARDDDDGEYRVDHRLDNQ